MNKTHVSILQEMMVKKGTVPNYELIHDGGGTHINTFTYRVSCDGLIATGDGRCKKDAKHTAAKNMLELIASVTSYLQLPATPADSPVRTPTPQALPYVPKNSLDRPFLNAIGELKELCAVNELQEPDYHMISDVGPPHARIFTYRCVVSTFREEGQATTKKQAKHEASRKMLERLLEVVSDAKDKDEWDRHSDNDNNETSRMCTDYDYYDESIQSRLELGKLTTKRMNLGLKFSDYHVKLKKSYTDDTVPTRLEVLTAFDRIDDALRNHTDECTVDSLIELKTNFKRLLNPLNMDISSVVLDCESSSQKVVFVKLTSTPDLTESEIGADVASAELRAMAKVVKTFRLLMEL